jgi:hypothetical protein
MKRLIRLTHKAGNDTYVCDGTGCNKCAVRYMCFTGEKSYVFVVNWQELKTKKSPQKFLEGVTGSRIYVKGSKRYQKIIKEISKNT